MPEILPPALQAARTAQRVLSKLSGVVLLQSTEEEMRSETALPQMINRVLVAVKSQANAATPTGDIYASPEAFAAAVLNTSEQNEKYFLLDLILAKPSEESVIAMGLDNQIATQLVQAKTIGILSAAQLEEIQSQITLQQMAPTYTVATTFITRAPQSGPTSEEIMEQIEKSVKPLPSNISQQAVRELMQHAQTIKNPQEGLAFFLREMPFAMQQH